MLSAITLRFAAYQKIFLRKSLGQMLALAFIFTICLFLSPQMASAQSVQTLCNTDPTPAGYVVVAGAFKVGCYSAGGGFNAKIVETPNGRESITICSFSPIPSDYYVSQAINTGGCNPFAGMDISFVANAKVIKKPRPSDELISACPGSTPPSGWAPTGSRDPVSLCNISSPGFADPTNRNVFLKRTGPPLKPPTFSTYNTLLINIARLKLESHINGIYTPLPYRGIVEGLSGSTIYAGDYFAETQYPYIQFEKSRKLLLLHPGSTGNLNQGASVGIDVFNPGIYAVEGAFARANNFQLAGDGVSVAIYRNLETTPLFTGIISSNHVVDSDYVFWGTGVLPFKLNVPLSKGDTLRFVVFSGPSRTNGDFDVTALTATISPTP